MTSRAHLYAAQGRTFLFWVSNVKILCQVSVNLQLLPVAEKCCGIHRQDSIVIEKQQNYSICMFIFAMVYELFISASRRFFYIFFKHL